MVFNEAVIILFICFIFSFQCWRWNPEPTTFWASVVPLNYIPTPNSSCKNGLGQVLFVQWMFSHFHHEILQAVSNIFFSWLNFSLTAFGWFQALTFLLTFRKIIINFLFPCQEAFWWFVLFLFPRPQCCLLLTFFSSLRGLVPSRHFFFQKYNSV